MKKARSYAFGKTNIPLRACAASNDARASGEGTTLSFSLAKTSSGLGTSCETRSRGVRFRAEQSFESADDRPLPPPEPAIQVQERPPSISGRHAEYRDAASAQILSLDLHRDLGTGRQLGHAESARIHSGLAKGVAIGSSLNFDLVIDPIPSPHRRRWTINVTD